jgi:hypothetical protein
MSQTVRPFDRSDFEQLWQFNPHARLGRADATNNFNQMLHKDAERFSWRGAALVVLLIRFVGVLFGAVAVACAFLIANVLTFERLKDETLNPSNHPTPQPSNVAILAASLVAFNPMFVHIMASVNNDTLATALSSIALLLGARMIARGATLEQAALLGVVLGCAALTKVSGAVLGVVVPTFVVVSSVIRHTTSSKRNVEDPSFVARRSTSNHLATRSPIHPLILVIAIILPILVISGWWYWRNYALYGDPTGTQMMAAIAGAREAAPTLVELLGEWDGFFKAYWGLFGAVNIVMESWIYRVLEVVTIAAGVGLMLVVRDWKRSSIAEGRQPSFVISLMFFTAFAVAFVALVRWTSMTLASQGRLLFPVIVAISTLLAIGLSRLTAHRLSLTAHASLPIPHTILIVALAALTFAAPFVYMRPAYATPNRQTSETQLPPDMTRTELVYEDKIRWIGFRVNTLRQRVQPGEVLDVTLYWQGLRPMDKNYSAFIKLFGRGDVEWFNLDTYPGGGMFQTTLWKPNDVIEDRYRLRLPDVLNGELPTVLRIDVGFYEGSALLGDQRVLTTFDRAGKQTGRQRYEAASLGFATGQTQRDVTAMGSVERARVIKIEHRVMNDVITFIPTWQTTDDFVDDYTVFVQLFDSQNKMIGQGDGRAANNDFSTKWWRKGDVIIDTHIISLEQSLAPGKYVIHYGLYKPTQNFPRMAGFDASGARAKDDALVYAFEVK